MCRLRAWQRLKMLACRRTFTSLALFNLFVVSPCWVYSKALLTLMWTLACTNFCIAKFLLCRQHQEFCFKPTGYWLWRLTNHDDDDDQDDVVRLWSWEHRMTPISSQARTSTADRIAGKNVSLCNTRPGPYMSHFRMLCIKSVLLRREPGSWCFTVKNYNYEDDGDGAWW